MNVSTTNSLNKKEDSPKNRIISYVLFTSGLAFIVLLIILSWNELQPALESINWTLFILSIVLFMIGNLITSIFFHDLLKKYSIVTSFRLANKIFFYGQIAKYVPGKIWSLFYQAAFLKTLGGTSALLYTNIDITVSLLIVNMAIALSFILSGIEAIYALSTFIIGLVVYLVTVRSCCIFRFIGSGIALIKIPVMNPIECKPHFSYGRILLYYFSNWVFPLGAFFLMLYATFNFTVEESAMYIAYLYLAWIVSMFAFVVPAGLGVKELLFVLLAKYLSGDVSLDMLAAIAVVSRFWGILQDMTGAGIVFLWDKRK